MILFSSCGGRNDGDFLSLTLFFGLNDEFCALLGDEGVNDKPLSIRGSLLIFFFKPFVIPSASFNYQADNREILVLDQRVLSLGISSARVRICSA